MLDLYTSLNVHTTVTIAEGRRQMEKFAEMLQVSMSPISQEKYLLRLRRSKAFSAQYFYTVVVSLKLFRCFCKQVWSQVFIKLS